jgi:hypothetical protein
MRPDQLELFESGRLQVNDELAVSDLGPFPLLEGENSFPLTLYVYWLKAAGPPGPLTVVFQLAHQGIRIRIGHILGTLLFG